MTVEEYIRLKTLLNTVVEQQATFAENQTKADARMSRHEGALAALLTLAECMNTSDLKLTSALTQNLKTSPANSPKPTIGSMLS